MPKYALHDGELVSLEWKSALDAVEKKCGPIWVSEGHRTMARQQYFWNCYRCQCCNGGNLAAYPSPWAPHIRTGRIDHALDVDNGAKLVGCLRQIGISASLPVGGENWHVEANANDLKRFHQKRQGPDWDDLPRHLTRRVKRFFAARNTVRNRIRDRDRVDSKKHPAKWEDKDKLVKKWVRIRNRRRKSLERALRRARNDKTKRLLRKALESHPRKD